MKNDPTATEETAAEENPPQKSSPSQAQPPAPAKTSLLPAASASLPPLPPKREPAHNRRDQPPPSIIPSRDSVDNGGMQHYQGWLREPYGAGSGQAAASDDLP